jgi:hypothetical protein
MDKQLFEEVIGEVAPSTVDVEAIITRGRRADRIRRVANPVVAAGVAVVLLSGAVVYTMTGDGGGGLGIGGQPTPSRTVTSQPATSTPKGQGGEAPEACSRPDLESAAEVIARLNPLVAARFRAQRPDATLEVNPSSEDPAGESHEPLEFYQVAGYSPEDVPICEFDSYIIATATVRAPEGDGNILISLAASYADAIGPVETCETLVEVSHLPYCEEVAGPNGEIIVRTTNEHENGTISHLVDIYRQDGTVVRLMSANVGTDVKTDDPPTAPLPPLSHDQLVAIGTAPGMTLFQ